MIYIEESTSSAQWTDMNMPCFQDMGGSQRSAISSAAASCSKDICFVLLGGAMSRSMPAAAASSSCCSTAFFFNMGTLSCLRVPFWTCCSHSCTHIEY